MGENEEVIIKLESHLRYILIISMIPSIIIITLRDPLLTILLKRGSFDELSVLGTTSVLPYFVLSAVLISSINLMRNWFYSSGLYRVAAYLGILFILSFFLLSGALIKSFSYKGIGLAYLLVWILYWILSTLLIKTSNNKLLSRELLLFCIKTISIAVISYFIVSTIIGLPIFVSPFYKILFGGGLELFCHHLI